MTERNLNRRLTAWWILVGALAVLAFASNASDSEPIRNELYRYDTAVFGGLFYLILLGLTLAIGSGLDSRDAFALRRPESWKRAALLGIGVFIGMWIVAAILDPIFHAGEEQGLDPTRIHADQVPPFLVNVLLLAVLAPIVEELIYRGIGFTLLQPLGEWAAIAVTSFAFALAHGIVDGIPVFFVIGFAFALVRSRTRSVYPGMAMHGVFNAIQAILGALT